MDSNRNHWSPAEMNAKKPALCRLFRCVALDQVQSTKLLDAAHFAEHIAKTMGSEFRVTYRGSSNQFVVTSNRSVSGAYRSLNPKEVADSIFPWISISITTFVRPDEWRPRMDALEVVDRRCRDGVAKFAGQGALETYFVAAPNNAEEWLAVIEGGRVSDQLSSFPTHYFGSLGLRVETSHLVKPTEESDPQAKAIEQRFTDLIRTFVENR